MSDHQRKYMKIMKDNKMLTPEAIKANAIEDSEEVYRSSIYSRQSSLAATDDNIIQLGRYKTHLIYDVGTEVFQKNTFTRNCTFDYSMKNK